MADKITYYAIVDDLSSREQPAGVLRRIYFEAGGRRDEAFSQDLVWERTAMLVSAERGDLQNEFIEITEEEANQIVARIRTDVTGASSTQREGRKLLIWRRLAPWTMGLWSRSSPPGRAQPRNSGGRQAHLHRAHHRIRAPAREIHQRGESERTTWHAQTPRVPRL